MGGAEAQGPTTPLGPAQAFVPADSPIGPCLSGILARDLVGVRVNATIASGFTLEEIRRAPSVELDSSWYYDLGGKSGRAMEKRFVGPFHPSGLPCDPAAPRAVDDERGQTAGDGR